MTDLNKAKLDAWITGNWGYDHPDNEEPTDQERHEMICREIDREAKIRRAFQWTFDHCNGIDNIGLCPVCGERVQVLGSKVGLDGSLFGSCGDAFTIERWESED